MSWLPLSCLELSILLPLAAALVVARLQNLDRARHWSVVVSGLALMFALAAWWNFSLADASPGIGGAQSASSISSGEIFVIDRLSAPLLPLVALLYFLNNAVTLRTKMRHDSFAPTLVSSALALATFSCRMPWLLIGLLTAATVPPFLELRARGRCTRIYVIHMALFIGLLVAGEASVGFEAGRRVPPLWSIVLLLGAVLVRSGIVPFHCWMTDLFEHASFGSALLYVAPLTGAYVAVRLVLPIAPDWVLRSLGLLSLATAVYAAGMALIQRDARRFFCYLFLSHSALVLVGLEMVTPIGLTGALCVWLSAALALGGLGLTLRALESRVGRLSLTDFQGLYDHTPNLAMCFVLTGLASVGFPGTFGFVGAEMLVDGAVEAYLSVGLAVVVAAALNGIAIIKTYFLLFTGTTYNSSISLQIRVRERYAVIALTALILIGGFVPQPGVASRYRAAEDLLHARAAFADESVGIAWRAVGQRGAD